MMVLVFSQWCINHNLDPFEIYAQAYPTQRDNPLLTDTLAESPLAVKISTSNPSASASSLAPAKN